MYISQRIDALAAEGDRLDKRVEELLGEVMRRLKRLEDKDRDSGGSLVPASKKPRPTRNRGGIALPEPEDDE